MPPTGWLRAPSRSHKHGLPIDETGKLAVMHFRAAEKSIP